jgi:hypothetical protein
MGDAPTVGRGGVLGAAPDQVRGPVALVHSQADAGVAVLVAEPAGALEAQGLAGDEYGWRGGVLGAAPDQVRGPVALVHSQADAGVAVLVAEPAGAGLQLRRARRSRR